MIGKALKKDSQPIIKFLEGLSQDEKKQLADEMQKTKQITVKVNEKDFKLGAESVKFEKYE